MSPEERIRAAHQLMHEKHKGHEAMHSEMVLILFITLIIAQVTLVEWKKRHYKSYSVFYIFVIRIGIHMKNIRNFIIGHHIACDVDYTTSDIDLLQFHTICYHLDIVFDGNSICYQKSS